MAVQERDLNGDDDFADDDEVVYYHSNTLYSVYALSDADENVVERMRYDAYGAATVLDADFSSDADGASDVENPYTFTARRWDVESGLLQYRNRYYDPALGRFVGRDPVLSQNLYQMVGGRPGTAIDPYGLQYDDGTNIWDYRERGEYIGPRSTGDPATSPDTPEQYRRETPEERKQRLERIREREKRERERKRREKKRREKCCKKVTYDSDHWMSWLGERPTVYEKAQNFTCARGRKVCALKRIRVRRNESGELTKGAESWLVGPVEPNYDMLFCDCVECDGDCPGGLRCRLYRKTKFWHGGRPGDPATNCMRETWHCDCLL